MERPFLSRLIARALWGGEITPYYESMGAIAEVPEGGLIVDCPCGAGPALRALRPEAAVRYIAADLSPSMIRRTGRRTRLRELGNVEFVQADATYLPVSSASADLFLSYWGLHCFDDPAAAIMEAARVLEPRRTTCRLLLCTGDGGPAPATPDPSGVRRFRSSGTRREVEGWLAYAGFLPLSIAAPGRCCSSSPDFSRSGSCTKTTTLFP